MPETFRKKKIAAMIAAALLIGGIGTFWSQSGTSVHAEQTTAVQAVTVDVAAIESRLVTDWQDYSGRLEAVERVEIRPLVSGTLTRIHFKDGDIVKKGDTLFTIDPRPFEAEVARTQALVSSAEARVDYTTRDLERAERLIGDNAIARRDFEEKRNAALEAQAGLLAAQAQLQTAQLNLEYSHITAPVTGRISRAEVTLGNIVSAGANSVPLTTLVSTANIYAAIEVDEQSYLKFISPVQAGNHHQIKVVLGLANEEGFSRHGHIGSVDNRLDTASGTIRVRAVFDNADGVLLPGLFARVRLGSGNQHEALLIDEKAVGTDQDKRFVLVVNEQGQANYREVHIGALQGHLREVESGLQAGERIVVNGLQRVKPGQQVTPHLVAMPGSEAQAAHESAADIGQTTSRKQATFRHLPEKRTKAVSA
ncbi:membrane fusion protein, multidrug efflux system [Methylobacillus rhizosphaerae]|uniref:Membrane fusion protein, multidrug efflux system n=1 Tax=Methylobacillus rhizosphaerae TaxID=551994 RepID=A0A238ZN51_9PROT|nr:efflux RND transporter periplasmic adaptor subunit [Methylobacillus rhizosphaerae]SNR84124.1 membrane fusion protein, multidrug efflux system [Methylobacillus rhizosphaerae]